MNDDAVNPADIAAPDANVTPVEDSAAAPSPAVNDADENEITRAAKGVGKRIDELTRLRRDAERDRDHWRDLALRQSPQTRVETSTPTESPKTLADFEYDEGKFQAYVFDEAKKLSSQAVKQALKDERDSEAKERRKTSFASRASDFAKTVEDYEAVVTDPQLPISQVMAEVIQDSDDGPALAYHLGKNPDIAEKLAQLPPNAAARELGKLEAQLAYEREKAKQKPVVSNAPPPPPQIGASDAAAKVSTADADSDRLSDEEWMRAERKRMSRRN